MPLARHALALVSLAALFALTGGCSKKDGDGASAVAPPGHDAPAQKTAQPSQPAANAAEATPLKEGQAAPDVDLPLQDGKTVKLSSFKGKRVALYFYPKDQTQGCTIEAQGMRDNWDALKGSDITVIGVSTQDAASHKDFIAKEKLPFDLAIDTDGKIAKAFGVPVQNGYTARQTFLIGKDGTISKSWRSVTPKGHAEEIVAASKTLPAGQ